MQFGVHLLVLRLFILFVGVAVSVISVRVTGGDILSWARGKFN
jgi:hypothetical protein